MPDKQDMLDRKAVIAERWFDKLFEAFSKDVKTTVIVILSMVAIWQQNKINNLQEEKQEGDAKLYERIISRQDQGFADQDKRINQRIDTVKMVSDSSRKDIQSTTDVIKTVAGKLEKRLNKK